jgi:hypothetical protein
MKNEEVKLEKERSMEEFAALTCYALLEARCKPPSRQAEKKEDSIDRHRRSPLRYTLDLGKVCHWWNLQPI